MGDSGRDDGDCDAAAALNAGGDVSGEEAWSLRMKKDGMTAESGLAAAVAA